MSKSIKWPISIFITVWALLLVAFSAQAQDAYSPFRYDPLTEDQVKIIDTKDEGDTRIINMSYVGADDRLVFAYLIVPQGTGPFGGIIYMHSGFGDRTQFLDARKRRSS